MPRSPIRVLHLDVDALTLTVVGNHRFGEEERRALLEIASAEAVENQPGGFILVPVGFLERALRDLRVNAENEHQALVRCSELKLENQELRARVRSYEAEMARLRDRALEAEADARGLREVRSACDVCAALMADPPTGAVAVVVSERPGGVVFLCGEHADHPEVTGRRIPLQR